MTMNEQCWRAVGLHENGENLWLALWLSQSAQQCVSWTAIGRVKTFFFLYHPSFECEERDRERQRVNEAMKYFIECRDLTPSVSSFKTCKLASKSSQVSSHPVTPNQTTPDKDDCLFDFVLTRRRTPLVKQTNKASFKTYSTLTQPEQTSYLFNTCMPRSKQMAWHIITKPSHLK